VNHGSGKVVKFSGENKKTILHLLDYSAPLIVVDDRNISARILRSMVTKWFDNIEKEVLALSRRFKRIGVAGWCGLFSIKISITQADARSLRQFLPQSTPETSPL
jgi:hypothetical protein